MAWDSIPRTHSFSLGDLHDFDRCVFKFFVNHHLQKKYELAEGNANQTIGSLLDLAIKKLHQNKMHNQPVEELLKLIEAARTDIKNEAEKRGKNSFFGPLPPFLTDEVVASAKQIFRNYHEAVGGKYKPMVPTYIMRKFKPFWTYVIQTTPQSVQLWGAPDVIELGEDRVPEIIDYKYRQNPADQAKMDMDLMPKVYTLLCASELKEMGYAKARFKVKFWLSPKDESFYEEFDLSVMPNLEAFFKDKIDRILRTSELSFCEKDFCKVCKSPQRAQWITQIQVAGWLTGSTPAENAEEKSDLPF